MTFSNPNTEEKYVALGFLPAGLGLKVTIAGVDLDAIKHPYKGVEIGFTCFTPRTATQFAITLPEHCSIEQIATLIYLNFRSAFRDKAEVCKQYFDNLKVHITTEGLPC